MPEDYHPKNKMPLPVIRLPESHLACTRFGFGTTSLLGLDSEQDRLALLERAFDLGIRHFDTAPYYGYGEAEKVLGRFLKSRREAVTVTTKFGIQPPAVARLESRPAWPWAAASVA